MSKLATVATLAAAVLLASEAYAGGNVSRWQTGAEQTGTAGVSKVSPLRRYSDPSARPSAAKNKHTGRPRGFGFIVPDSGHKKPFYSTYRPQFYFR
jgi:hypothetical protein